MKASHTFTLILSCIFISSACRKYRDCNTNQSDTNNKVTIYTAGYVHDGISNTATYWKNGHAILLPPTTNSNTNSFANDMAVSGNDVYIVGSSPLGPVYWKNGISHSVANFYAANAIAVSGNDVYIAGTVLIPGMPPTGLAVYWKNGTQVSLSQGYKNANATDIVLSGNDVYVCGWSLPGRGYERATYWKNGSPVFLTDENTPSRAFGMFIQGNDVYVAGNANDSAVYWKNGQMVTLQGGDSPASAGRIAIVGSDVYVTGGIYNRTKTIFNAVYWKNGQMVRLADAASQSHASSMAVLGNDVYIGGMVAKAEGTGYHQFEATYWKNGVATTLPYNGNPGYRYVFAIAVSGK